MIGRRLLVGITLRDGAGTLLERRQFHGTVIDVAEGVVVLEHGPDGARVLLPADPDAYELARAGTYRLPSGEVLVDPDYLGVWEVVAAPDEAPPG